jgi:hypothetical protein
MRLRFSIPIVNIAVLVIAFMLNPVVPRSESVNFQNRGSKVERHSLTIYFSQQPLGTVFAAERLWHLHYFPVWLKVFTFLQLPSLLLASGVARALYFFLNQQFPWHRSWLNAALFLLLSSVQWFLIGVLIERWRARKVSRRAAGEQLAARDASSGPR